MAFFKMCLADNLQDASDCGGLHKGMPGHAREGVHLRVFYLVLGEDSHFGKGQHGGRRI